MSGRDIIFLLLDVLQLESALDVANAFFGHVFESDSRGEHHVVSLKREHDVLFVESGQCELENDASLRREVDVHGRERVSGIVVRVFVIACVESRAIRDRLRTYISGGGQGA